MDIVFLDDLHYNRFMCALAHFSAKSSQLRKKKEHSYEKTA